MKTTSVQGNNPSGAAASGTGSFVRQSSPTLITPKIDDGDTGVSVTSANQTHAAPTVTIPDVGDAADEFVMKDTTQTLTGKTLITPTISGAPVMTTSHASTGQHRFVEIALTAAEIKNLRATPKELVAAEAGKVHVVIGGCILLDYGTVQFAEDGGGSNLAVKYTDGSGVKASSDIESTGFIDQAVDTMTTIAPKTDGIVAKSGCENKALVLHNIGAGEIVTGDSVARVKLHYVTYTTAW